MTLGEFRNVISSKIGLDNTGGSPDQQLMNRWINEGVVQVLLRTRCRVNTQSFNLVSGTAEYSLEAVAVNTLGIQDALRTVAGTQHRLNRVSLDELLQIRTGQVSATGGYYYTVEGGDLFATYPVPAANESVLLYRIVRPTAMSADAHDPANATYGGVPTEFHKAIEYWALAEAADFDDDSSSGMGEKYRNDFMQEIVFARYVLLGRAAQRLSKTKLGGGRTIQIPDELEFFGPLPPVGMGAMRQPAQSRREEE
jgi:hypothetical protein